MVNEKLLKNEEIVLLHAYKEDTLVVEDVKTLLFHCSMSYASKLLSNLWKKGYLKRKRIKRSGGGRTGGKKFKYVISPEGEKVARWLKNQ